MSNKDKMASLFHEPENAMVYGTDQELNSGLSSEKVSILAALNHKNCIPVDLISNSFGD